MIKIALVSHTSAFAGAERMLYNLALLLQKSRDFEPVIFLPGTYDSNSHFYQTCEESGISVVWSGAFYGYSTWYLHGEFGCRQSENKQSILYAVRDMMKQFVHLDIQAVLTNTATNLVATICATQLNLPLIAWVHGIIDNAYLPINFDAEQRLLYDRVLINLSNQVICCSEWTCRFYKEFSVTPIVAVPNWYLPHDFTTDKKPLADLEDGKTRPEGNSQAKTFLCLSTFEEHKGIFMLFKAAEILLKNRKENDWRIELYGDGSPHMKEKMANYIKKHNLDRNIFVKARILDVDPVYRQSFCLLSPAYIEPFGMTLIEAMSHGKPVIAARSGGPAEIIVDEETGFLIDRDDSEAMAEKMLYLLDNPEVACAMGDKGKLRFAECFSEEAAEVNMLPLLEQTVRNYQGINQYQQLILDMTIHQLTVDAGSATPILAVSSGPPAVPYDPNSLCFSGVLRKSRRYGVSGRAGTLSAVGVLLANLGGPLEDGTLTLRLFQGGKVVAEAALAGTALRMDNWTYFSFPSVNISDKPLTVELCPEGMDGLGVYELRERRKFVYKVFNKLGYPLKGKDVLNVSLLP